MSTSVPISGLNDISIVRTTDFIPIVRSGSAASLTTFRASISEINNWFASSGSCLSASQASSSISASWAAFASLAFTSSYARTSSVSFSSTSASFSARSLTSSLSTNSITASFALTVVSSSFATNAGTSATASFVSTSSFALSVVSSSYALRTSNAASSSYATTASFSVSSSHASTASFIALTSPIVFLDTPVMVGASPATVTDPYLAWTQIIRTDYVPKPTFVSGTSRVGTSYINATPSLSAGPDFQFFAWNGTGTAPNTTNIPSSAKSVIIEGCIRTTWPDGFTNPPVVIVARRHGTAPHVLICASTNADPGNAGQTSINQAIIQLNPINGTFLWTKTPNGPNGATYAWFVRIIGYIT